VIKLVVVGVWLCAATIGAVFFAFQSAGSRGAAEAKEEASPTMMGGLDYVKTEVMSVPLIRHGEVQGYFLSRLVYTVNPEEMKKLTVPAQAVITDAVYSYVYSSPEIDFTRTDRLDLDAFRSNVRKTINDRIQHDLVKDVLIEQVEYLTKAEIRDNAVKRRQVVAERRARKTEATTAKPAH
jgi:flagellar basal body-associated protein FliL